MVELFDADLKRKGFDGVALPAGSYELHKINGVRLDINKSLDELGVQDGDTLVARGGGSGCDHDRRGDPQAVADRSGHRGGNGVRDPCRCRRRPNV